MRLSSFSVCCFKSTAPHSCPAVPSEMKARNVGRRCDRGSLQESGNNTKSSAKTSKNWEYLPSFFLYLFSQPSQALTFSISFVCCCVACVTSFFSINCVDTSFIPLPWWTNASFFPHTVLLVPPIIVTTRLTSLTRANDAQHALHHWLPGRYGLPPSCLGSLQFRGSDREWKHHKRL